LEEPTDYIEYTIIKLLNENSSLIFYFPHPNINDIKVFPNLEPNLKPNHKHFLIVIDFF